MNIGLASVGRVILRALRQFGSQSRGNIAPLIALLIVPIVGALAVGGETSSWFTMQRSQQHAADSAVIAAALNASASYATEARGVSATYGYPDGGNISVSPTTVACPTGAAVVAGTTCYQVSVNRTVPIYLTKVVGYTGDGTLTNGNRGKLIQARAIAGTIPGNESFCMFALTKLKLNGGNGTDLTGCDLLSGGDMQCSGTNSDNGVTNAYAAGTNQNCGSPVSVSNYQGSVSDPKAATVASNISSMDLSSCPTTAGITSLSNGVNCFTGTVPLLSNVTVSGNSVLVIKVSGSGNGSLNIGNFTLSTASGGSLTVVFTGSTRLDTPVIVSNGGTLNIAAPSKTSTSAWKGMTIVEDPAMTGKNLGGNTNALDINFSGGSNTITMNITGLIYLPHGDFDVTGAIDHASFSDHGSYDRCVLILANTITLSGTNDMLPNPASQCDNAGASSKTVPTIALLH